MYENFIANNLEKISGVYIIRNLTDNKSVYIGISHNILQRYKQHRVLLESGEHFNKLMLSDYKRGYKLEMSTLQDFSKQPPFIEKHLTEELYILYFVYNNYNVYNYSSIRGDTKADQIEKAKDRVIKKFMLQSGIVRNCNDIERDR